MQTNDESDSELAFLNAMQTYRRARESGDPKAIKEAEDAWREQVRKEMVQNESCQA